ncbi:hypothetical protein [Pontibacter pamirensis]|uniref:hypothetical protein n=1 Tax=Pontibacter pamirensis TaxID=2562824 RepID=UPI001389C1F3|nr:hypothetical protein [Pontibacter pamirensis]
MEAKLIEIIENKLKVTLKKDNRSYNRDSPYKAEGDVYSFVLKDLINYGHAKDEVEAIGDIIKGDLGDKYQLTAAVNGFGSDIKEVKCYIVTKN